MMGMCAALLVHSLVEVGSVDWRACMRCREAQVVQLLLLCHACTILQHS